MILILNEHELTYKVPLEVQERAEVILVINDDDSVTLYKHNDVPGQYVGALINRDFIGDALYDMGTITTLKVGVS